jgi:hypothetical protein
MYSVLDRPVTYADRSTACVDCPAIWLDHLVIYLDYPMLYTDGPNCSFRVCAEHGSSGADLGNSVLKTGRSARA